MVIMTRRSVQGLAITAGALAVGLLGRPAATIEAQSVADASCTRLTLMKVPGTTINSAQRVNSAEFVAAGGAPATASAPSPSGSSGRPFCRVAATLAPTADSDIKIELWLPVENWNQKFQAVGNGGFSGTISYAAMTAALARGYATASTDTGHPGASGSFALGHPEKAIDFGWRAVHEMAATSKRIINSYYERAPRVSYWSGCSAGGRQAMKEAQRFPADFDGIVAGAPGLDWTGRAAQALRIAKRLEGNQSGRLSEAHRRLLHTAVVQQCDARDGVTDGVIDDPRRCTFDPGVLACAGAPDATCLTNAQIETVRLMYSAGVNRGTRREIPALYRGSELGWTDTGWSAGAQSIGLDQFRFVLFQDPRWNISAFDFERDLARAEEADQNTINALDPDIRAFVDRGGKLIQYHGWTDPQISPGISIQYYDRVVEALGGEDRARNAHRLFMAPGMGHCGGGDGPNAFDTIAALEEWVEHGRPPDRIVATRRTNGVVDRTRPLCPYPQVALYRGAGSTNDAANFVCGTR